MVLKLLLILTSVLSQSLDDWQYNKFGRCKHVNKLDSLDLNFFNNHFYQILRSKGFPLVIGQCLTSTTSVQPDNSIGIHVTQIYYGMSIEADAVITLDFTPGHLGSVTFNSPVGPVDGHYAFTDFETYFVVYLCQSEKNSRRDLVEVYSIDVDFDYSFLLDEIYDLGFTDLDLEFVDHSPEACSVGPPPI